MCQCSILYIHVNVVNTLVDLQTCTVECCLGQDLRGLGDSNQGCNSWSHLGADQDGRGPASANRLHQNTNGKSSLLHTLLYTHTHTHTSWSHLGADQDGRGPTSANRLHQNTNGKSSLLHTLLYTHTHTLAEAILALTRMGEDLRVPTDCIRTPTVSLPCYIPSYTHTHTHTSWSHLGADQDGRGPASANRLHQNTNGKSSLLHTLLYTHTHTHTLAEAILALTRMGEDLRVPTDCIRTPTVSLPCYIPSYTHTHTHTSWSHLGADQDGGGPTSANRLHQNTNGKSSLLHTLLYTHTHTH